MAVRIIFYLSWLHDFLSRNLPKVQSKRLRLASLGWRTNMRTPFVNNQAPAAPSKTKKKVEQNVADGGNAASKNVLPNPTKTENKMVKNHTLLEEKVPSASVKTRKSLFRK
ncbi:hypothetical protein [Acetobacter sp. AAB5]|uniref:hypothetical protein n=1 Tax=Acetobacter sp. AAB5 TaxID=3418370 RepID=UPI003CE70D1D